MQALTGRTTIRTLHVDDDEMFGTVTAELLEAVEPRLEVLTATSASAGLELLADEQVDCIVSDYDMPGGTGISFLERVRERDARLPFILFTGKGSEEVASDAVSAGVTDYLQKEAGVDQYTVLANRVVNATEKYWTEVDLERRITQQEALATLGRDALAADGLASLFDTAVGLVADGLDGDYAKILEWRPERAAFDLRAGVGWSEAVRGRVRVPGGADSQAGYTLACAEPVVVDDLAEETRFGGPDLLVDHGVVSGISVAVGSVEAPWGVLGVHTASRREFTDQDVTFVQNVANVLAAAIDRQRAETRLRESESRFREIAELSPDGIFRTDVDGVFTYVSPASEALLGRSADDLVGTPFGRVVADGSHGAAREGIGRVIDGEVVRGLALTLVDDEGDPFDVEVSASPVRHDGDVEFVQGFARDVTEKNERERELQRSRERYRALVDAFPNGGVFLFDESLRYTMVGGDELLKGGLTAEGMVGRTPSDVFPPANAALLTESYRAALAGETRSFEDSYQGRHYQVQTIPLRNEAGEVISGMAVAQNITEHVERERELKESKEFYQTLIDNFPGGVVLFDHDLRVIAGGGTEFERASWNPDESVGEPLRDNLSPEGTTYLDTHYRAALAGETRSFEYEASGTHYHLQTLPLRDADGMVTAGMAVTQNVTARVEHERKLDQLRERSQALMHTETIEETARVAVDAAQEVIDAPLSGFHRLNGAGDRLEPGVMAGSVAEQFPATPCYDRDAAPGTRAAIAWEVFERDEPRYIPDVEACDPLSEQSPAQSALLHPVGHHGLFIVSSPVADAYDETDRALVDILVASLTAAMDRVEREQRLRRREQRLEQQNERLSRFASIVSHDLRNPLSVARGRLELARRTGDEEQFEAVANAHARMDRLIEGLLQLAVEGETGHERARLDLATAATASWESVETADASLAVETTRRVLADESRLRQLFENLFRNAVEHGVSADAGPLTVTICDLPAGFAVEDDGVGIPPGQVDAVFDAGHSTSAEGTGLGLRIVADIAAEHGWSVRVVDGTEGGARFEFTGVDVDVDVDID